MSHGISVKFVRFSVSCDCMNLHEFSCRHSTKIKLIETDGQLFHLVLIYMNAFKASSEFRIPSSVQKELYFLKCKIPSFSFLVNLAHILTCKPLLTETCTIHALSDLRFNTEWPLVFKTNSSLNYMTFKKTFRRIEWQEGNLLRLVVEKFWWFFGNHSLSLVHNKVQEIVSNKWYGR